MLYVALGASVLALIVALVALSKAGALRGQIREADQDAKRRAENLGAQFEQSAANLRQLLALVAEKKAVSRDMILEGRLWQDVSTAGAKTMLESGDVRIVDVRSPQETAGGILPGAMRIPIDELADRAKEIPRDGKRTLVYCAGGGRSAAACEFLSGQGYAELFNLEGGINAWTGPTVRPTSG